MNEPLKSRKQQESNSFSWLKELQDSQLQRILTKIHLVEISQAGKSLSGLQKKKKKEQHCSGKRHQTLLAPEKQAWAQALL